ncbi:zf-HC2 domain-containing protein [Dyella acidiphila]|uniref:Zf-HC2 domain-containing protein n=1 Tax=Dyella acidiphila TaxID=2775866 RepID=A0ABR9GD07_9GAMM|nr:zf-HC2 domain-containing protein [Dyella acidiphila]MBE1161917.1 zf-HC2 domain-containing protein [Dyella acidiphila]
MTTLPTYSSQDCPRAWDAMPWVLQDSATPEQREWLDQHLAHCAACRAEFAQQTRLHRAMALPADVPVDAEAGLQRLLGRLDTPQQEPQRLRVGGWLTRALAAAVLLQAIGIGAMGLKLWSGGNTAAYQTLSQAAAPVAPGAIRVVPDTSMTLADWNALLHSLQLQVVGGPNEVGAYTVAPAASAPATRDALQQLRAARGVRLAEPVTDTP